MHSKLSQIALSIGLINLSRVAAQFDASYAFWSGSGCGNDEATAFEEISSLPEYFVSTDENQCRGVSMNLPGFPMEQGLYQTYVDGSFLKEGCEMIFYDAPPDEESEKFTCDTGVPTRIVKSDSGCVFVPVPKKYAYGYCCGEDVCANYKPASKRDETAIATRDVAAIKRAPLLKSKKRDETCQFVKGEGSVKITYGRSRSVGQEVICAQSKIECDITGEYTATTSISHSTSSTHSVNVGATGGSPFFQISASYGHEWTKTEEQSFSEAFGQSITLHVPAGANGHLNFKPKMLCGYGHFEGDGCDESIQGGEDYWCIPAMTRGTGGNPIPAGAWSVLVY